MANRRSRPQVSQVRGGPMFVVAGLPPTTHNRAMADLRARFPEGKIVGSPSTPSEGELYPPKLCESLVRAVTEFVIRRRISAQVPVAPRYIMLLYVPAPDVERLLSSFDFAVMPEAMDALCERDTEGQQLRHSYKAVADAITEAVATGGRARTAINLVMERLNRLSDAEVLLLSPRNFWTADGLLGDLFKDFRSGQRGWSDRASELGPVHLTSKDIARIPANQTRRAFVDVRGLAFLTAHPKAFHALPRLVDEEELGPRLSVLKSLYRFGGAIKAGFHYDVQSGRGLALNGCEFDCSTDGRVSVENHYANIYPNDFVRAVGKKKINAAT